MPNSVALGKYAIFVPLATGNGEQAKNADFLISHGRAQVIPQAQFSSEWLIRNLPHAFEIGSALPLGGSEDDLGAVEKIIELMVRATDRDNS
ncbi:MAG: glycosyltransferase [Actinomycetota bacterium]